ncbi:Globin domain containing protein [Trichuris trichiura]|uniref:Globin domain containing protein n=1 Tax=Trichuris trichiura TaxID=36087 RepID=A0A077Z1I4_TRITR|nr:Globin domain containing protein [Trichuris trichiura]
MLRSLNLSPKDVKVIEESWMHIKDKEKLVIEILERLLVSNDGIRKIFNLHECPDDQLCENDAFKRHVKGIEHFLGICVNSIKSQPSRLVNTARSLGEKHFYFGNVVFDAEYWLLMKEVIIDVVASKQRPKKATQVLKDAFLREQRKRNTMRRNDQASMKRLSLRLQNELALILNANTLYKGANNTKITCRTFRAPKDS